jgi:hypothetical protein
MESKPNEDKKTALEHVHLPRISIKFCTQCRWMLRAAYVSPIRPITSPVRVGLFALGEARNIIVVYFDIQVPPNPYITSDKDLSLLFFFKYICTNNQIL